MNGNRKVDFSDLGGQPAAAPTAVDFSDLGAKPEGRTSGGVSGSWAEDPSSGILSAAADVGKGALKGVGHTLAGMFSLLGPAAGPIGVIAQPYARQAEKSDALKPQGTAQTAGYIGEQVGEFLLPAGAEAKVAKGAEEAIEAVKLGPVLQKWLGIGVKAAASAASTAGVAAVQHGDVPTAAALGAAGPIAETFVGPLATALSEKLPARLVNSLIRPGLKDFNFGKNPGGGVAPEGIVAASADGLAQKIVSQKHTIGSAIDAQLQTPAVAAKIIDTQPLIDGPIDAAVKEAVKAGNQKLADRILALREGLTSEFAMNAEKRIVKAADRPLRMSPFDAAQLKRGIGSQTKWVDPATEPFNETLNHIRVQIYGNLNDAIDAAAPGTKALNGRYANLLSAEKSLEKAVKLAQRKVIAGLGDVAVGAAAGLYGAREGDVGTGIANGLTAIALRHMLASTAGKTAGAQLLRKTPAAVSAAAQVGRAGYLVSTQDQQQNSNVQ